MYQGDDRELQVNYLNMLASDIRSDMVGPGTPTEQVDYFLSEETMPDWFDEHDRALLIELVGE